MKSLMLHVGHDAGFDGRFQVALDIARRLDAHVTLVQPSLAQDFVAFDMAGGAHFVAQAYAIAEQGRAEVKERVETDLANEGVNWDWQTIDGASSVAILAEAARLSDLAILSLDDKRQGAAQPGRSLVGDLAMMCRTPVLAVPPGVKTMSFGTAMIAYDGGPEASFAIRAASPLLALCETVKIAEVDAEAADYPYTDAADYLARHGINAVIEPVVQGGRTVEELLLASSEAFGADILVMGAYGHSRWREALFGGVTHYVLAETKIPVLLAH
jgi:nucleotide-binding universal stress UspA family protein